MLYPLFVPDLGGTRGVVAMAGDGPSWAEDPMLLGLLALMMWLVVGLYSGTTASLERESIEMEVRAPRHAVCDNGWVAEE
jgi:hypothetical protein